MQARCLRYRNDWRRAVYGCGGGVYEAIAFIVGHGLEKRNGCTDVVSIVGQGNLGRFTYGFVRLIHVRFELFL